MTWALLLLTAVAPTVLLAAVWSLIPSAEERPRWRVALAERLERAAARLRRERPVPEDPFQTLRVQQRLGVVAAHVRRLEDDDRMFARAERIIASQLAYDQLLAEACRMAGVEVLPAAKGDPAERFREEVELAERGWSW
ncbi:hypothetical protein [Cellulomonas shaoxiangyii]|uniref:Uncharacterized protein n=1 Tax=Cellulomonas shaoxiangyii TaxID=2566013 RepID=A0A4V1CMB7_9CELL|nr:hypothetical protein [Cellulomonas shaoxiangyii]QCB92385.1 hypothetical protein E5225_01270 [Cellulomonas shaoxiangyii]TGY86221.1 hypothetical protein E5226_02595 [Cellulomonas shaoxiangyii]